MRILVLSLEVWRDDNNGGNVLSNIFTDFDAEFAQIFCSAGQPNNDICKRYYQMTDVMAIKNILQKKKMGVVLENIESVPNEDKVEKQLDKIKRRGSFEIFRILRECVWGLAKYKNQDLEKFVRDFDPDVIFAPCYSTHYMLNLTRYVAQITGKPIISYVSDDVYSLRQWRFSPLYWINRFLVRRNMRRTWPYYSLVYTMTDLQKNEMEQIFRRPMKILRKSGEFEVLDKEKTTNTPIRFIYAGGVYLNRWKTLCKLVLVMRKINEKELRVKLDIYTNNQVKKRAEAILNDGRNAEIHAAVSQQELRMKYKTSDVALHVEGFDIKNRLNVRQSFSTKIVDCLESGCAVLAICDAKQGGHEYLRREDAAICIDNLSDIESVLKNMVNNPNLIREYREKAFLCGQRNHMRDDMSRKLCEDFQTIIETN